MKTALKLGTTLAVAAFISTGASAQQTLTSETASVGSPPQIMAAAMAEFASGASVANMQVADGQTLTNSLQNVAEGKTDVASAPFILPFLMARGAGPYGKLGAAKGADLAANIRVLFTYSFGVHTLYAYNSSPVKGWGDLKGKRILNGPPRGGALSNGRAIIKIVTGLDDGKGYKGVQLSWGQIPQAIVDNSADAVVLPGAFPGARVTRALSAGKMTRWGVPMDIWEGAAMQKYLKSPGTGPMVLKVSDITPQEGLTIVPDADGNIRMPSTIGGEVVHKKMSNELAKSLTALAIKNFEAIKAKAPLMKYVGLGATGAAESGMCGPNPLKYHPGAVAAWEEAGYSLPDCAKP